MRELLQKLFRKTAPSEVSKLENVEAELDQRLSAIVNELRRLQLPQQQIADELHDSVERVTGEAEIWRSRPAESWRGGHRFRDSNKSPWF